MSGRFGSENTFGLEDPNEGVTPLAGVTPWKDFLAIVRQRGYLRWADIPGIPPLQDPSRLLLRGKRRNILIYGVKGEDNILQEAYIGAVTIASQENLQVLTTNSVNFFKVDPSLKTPFPCYGFYVSLQTPTWGETVERLSTIFAKDLQDPLPLAKHFLEVA